MGVPVAWDALKPGFSERVQFAEFVEKWNEEHHRPLRIAIDAYMWLFESFGGMSMDTKGQKSEEVIGKVLINIMSRIKLLVSLNVSFVFVFDGRFKPSFKRKLTSQKDEEHLHDKDFDAYYKDAMRKIRYERYNQADTKEVVAVKKLLTLWNMPYVDAPAEGEAEAARLQREGVVDYVVSNDSDTFAFGATCVLRNFSKFRNDNPASYAPKGQEEEDKSRHTHYVTPVHLEQVEIETGYDTARIIMFSILLGADYNKGVSRLGASRAGQLALSGDGHMIAHVASFDYTILPDFSQTLYNIYNVNSQHSGSERKRKYAELQEEITRYVSEKSKVYFNRNETISCSGFAPDFVVNLFFRPLLCPKMFSWTPGHNNAESKVFPLMNFTPLYEFLLPYPWPGVKEKIRYFAISMTECYMHKWVLEHQGDTWKDHDTVKFVKVIQQDEDGYKRLSLSLNHQLFKVFQMTNFYIDPEEAAKGFSTKISIDLLPHALSEHLCQLENERSPKKAKSPRKKLPASSKPKNQKALSASDLSPTKAKASKTSKAVAATKKKSLAQLLEDEIPGAFKKSATFRAPMSIEPLPTTATSMKRSKTLMPDDGLPPLRVPMLKKTRTELDDPFGSAPINIPITSTIREEHTEKAVERMPSMSKTNSMESTSSSTSLALTQKIESPVKRIAATATSKLNSPKKSKSTKSPFKYPDIGELLSPKKNKSNGSDIPPPPSSNSSILTSSTLKLPSMDVLFSTEASSSSSSKPSSMEQKPVKSRIMMPTAADGVTPPRLKKRRVLKDSSKELSSSSSTKSIKSTNPLKLIPSSTPFSQESPKRLSTSKKRERSNTPPSKTPDFEVIDLDTPEPPQLPRNTSLYPSESSEVIPTPNDKDLGQLQTLASPSQCSSKSSQPVVSEAMKKLTSSAMKDAGKTLDDSDTDDIQVLSGDELENIRKLSDMRSYRSPVKTTPVKKKKKKRGSAGDGSPVRKLVFGKSEDLNAVAISLTSDDDDVTLTEVVKHVTLSPAKEVIQDIDFDEEMSDDFMDDTKEITAAGSQLMGSQMSSQALLEGIDLSDDFDDDL